ncbi:MAG TPA: GNAT family N-acetyltransferase [Saprospiraceae bacterium]|nr:GNAT family N-acetyltransferase [Saprospiraceae bacterium]HNT21775.1 GNAT family N-acetyltransferase [Saprospiraceae bacterium]
MSSIIYRNAEDEDISHLAEIRANRSATKEYWFDRIQKYSIGLVNPQEALPPRVIYLALDGNKVVGFVAGHLTRRLNCDGELQWIDTVDTYRKKGIASNLIGVLAKWFIGQQAYKICVDPGDEIARNFYLKNGANNLNEHWLYWPDIRTII